MKYLFKYLTSAPIMATLTMVVLAGVLIELNLLFPGLQYGTYFHTVP
jgi:Photosystem I reaction centre subunit IX / PsaJ